MLKYHRSLVANLILASSLFAASGLALADDKKPVGTVTLEEKQMGFFLGGSAGEGVLTVDGKQHRFKIQGLSAGFNVGASKMSASGEVFDMKNIDQFPGTYTKLDASVAVGGGVGGMHLKNQNGVVMTLHSRTTGLDLNLGNISGLTVTMIKP